MIIFVAITFYHPNMDKRSQPLEGGTCREKEVQSMAIQTTGMCANDCVEMVYQFVTTSVGDADENCKTA